MNRRRVLLAIGMTTVEDGVTLERPRLVTAGDVKGGRYVSDAVTLKAGTAR